MVELAYKAVQELGKVLRREARIAINTARSGAPIRAGRTEPENTVFAANSFFHREYELSKVKDAVKSIREAQCPRLALADEMENLLIALMQGFISKDTARSLLKKLDGPQALLEALGRLAENPADASDRADAITALRSDLKRINHVRRASFVHPNEKGAQRFTNVIVKRYTERYQRIRLRDDLRQLQ